jgi:hypothetical protein
MPRTLIEPHKGDKRYVRRKKGKFTKSQDDAMMDQQVPIYRQRAKECTELAQSATHPRERDKFLELAQRWHELADRREATYGPPHNRRG